MLIKRSFYINYSFEMILEEIYFKRLFNIY